MAKRKRDEAPRPITAVPKDYDRCVGFHDSEKEKADLHRDSAKAALEPLVEKGLRMDALKSALKLRKLDPLARRAWLDSFEHACAALNLDAQLEMPFGQGTAAAPSSLN